MNSTADMLGSHRSPVHRFALGETEITYILDGAMPMATSPPFLLDKSEKDIAEIVQSAKLPTDRLENNFVSVLVNAGGTRVLANTGCGHYRRDDCAGFLRERLSEAGYAPEEIDVVALTHVHPDYIGGLWEDGDPAFPKAKLIIGRREFDTWKSGDDISSQCAQNRELFFEIVALLEEEFRFLEDGDEVVPGVRAEAAFGHSAGHLMFRVASARKQVLI